MNKFLMIVVYIIGIKPFQFFLDKINKLALLGMNIGMGTDIENSGEKNVLRYVFRKSKKDITLFDVGANIGQYTLFANKIFNKKINIYAFEPAKNTFYKLRSNTENYNNIKIFNIGFSSKNENKILFSNDVLSGLSSLYNWDLERFKIKLSNQEIVEILTIDDFCKKNNITEIDFLKLDIEGNEYEALIGAKEMLQNDKIKYIQFEFGGCNIDSKTFFKNFYDLLKVKYKIYRVLRNSLYEIKEYREDYEIFKTTNFFAEKLWL